VRSAIRAPGKRIEKPMRIVLWALMEVVVGTEARGALGACSEFVEQCTVEQLDRGRHRAIVTSTHAFLPARRAPQRERAKPGRQRSRRTAKHRPPVHGSFGNDSVGTRSALLAPREHIMNTKFGLLSTSAMLCLAFACSEDDGGFTGAAGSAGYGGRGTAGAPGNGGANSGSVVIGTTDTSTSTMTDTGTGTDITTTGDGTGTDITTTGTGASTGTSTRMNTGSMVDTSTGTGVATGTGSTSAATTGTFTGATTTGAGTTTVGTGA
jgi:hypothetical protein